MEMKIKLEGYKESGDFTPFSENECRISLGQHKTYATEILLESIFRYLYKVLMNDADMQAG
jgi:hypothetical protein